MEFEEIIFNENSSCEVSFEDPIIMQSCETQTNIDNNGDISNEISPESSNKEKEKEKEEPIDDNINSFSRASSENKPLSKHIPFSKTINNNALMNLPADMFSSSSDETLSTITQKSLGNTIESLSDSTSDETCMIRDKELQTKKYLKYKQKFEKLKLKHLSRTT
mgnify:CR=1 FL=1